MRYFILAGWLVLLILAGCTRTAVDSPRLDPVSGVRIVFDKGPFSEEQRKVAYVTHVSSGSQMVIGRAGQVVSRHDGRGDGPAQLDAILADEVSMGDIIAGANAEGSPVPRHADWVNFVKFEGITYMANRGRGMVGVADLGAERYRVAFRLQDYAGSGYRSQDGDSVEGAPGLFGTEQKPQEKAKDAQIDQLYRHIGQLKVERDFLAERSGL